MKTKSQKDALNEVRRIMIENKLTLIDLQLTLGPLQVECKWCGKLMKKGDPVRGVSHGMCPKCKKDQDKELEELRKRLKEGE